MKQKRFNVEQIVAVLKQAEAGVPLAELIRRVGISDQALGIEPKTVPQQPTLPFLPESSVSVM